MRILKLLAIASTLVAISACDTDKSTSGEDALVSVSATSNYSVKNGLLPFPSDLLFTGTADGTLNIPVDDPNDLSDPAVAMNALDGFSTVSPITTGFTDAILSSSVSGDSVKMYKVGLSSTPGGAVISIIANLTYGVDFAASVSSIDTSGSTLAIVPLKPLDPKSSYYVVITSALKSSNGEPMGSSSQYILTKSRTPLVSGGVSQVRVLSDADAAQLEPLRQLVSTSETTVIASDSSLSYDNIIMSWSFTTQSIGDVLTTVRSLITSAPATSLAASTVDLGEGAGPGKSYAGAANVYEGTIDVPYYLTAPSVSNPVANLTNPWQSENAFAGENNLTALNPLPHQTATLSIPLLVATPANPAFTKPWKTVIFQHGITSNRTAMLAAADALASAGFAVVAIDLPLHGVGSTDSFYQSGKERTFDVDFVTEDANGDITAEVPDGIPDSSGRHFVNLKNLLVTRDNNRQAVADLFALTAAIPTIDVDGGGADLDSSNIYFVGHSLGAMVGTVFTALEPNVKDAVFAFGGGSLPKILDGSAKFSPSIVAGLAAVGVSKGTADYESFLGAAQTVVDSGDPVNYAEDATAGRGVLFFEIVGGNTFPSDEVVPNTVPDSNDSGSTVPAPLAGTEPMLRLMGLTQVNSSQTDTSDLLLSVKFTAGNHRSILDRTAAPAVTIEMQSEMASFLAHDGMSLTVTSASDIATP